MFGALRALRDNVMCPSRSLSAASAYDQARLDLMTMVRNLSSFSESESYRQWFQGICDGMKVCMKVCMKG
jgi:hypothetical protein